MGPRLKSKSRLVIAFFTILFCANCLQGEGTVSSTSTDVTGIGQAVEVSSQPEVAETELEVGTVMGNPTAKPIRQLTLQTVIEASESTASETSSSDEASYCSPFALDESGLTETYSCQVAPTGYNLGVRTISFADCVAEDGAGVACADGTATRAVAAESLFDAGAGAIRRVEINDGGTAFEFESPAGGAESSGGLLFTVAYVEQRLPDEGSDPVEGVKIHPDLQGKSFRICTASESAGSEAMEAYCGQAGARMGDMLWDLDADGSFGFMLIDDEPLVESGERPDDYDSMNVYDILKHGTQTDLIPLFPGDEFVTLVAGFDAMTGLSEDADFAATVTFDITDTLSFLDGQRAITKCAFSHDADLCRDAESGSGSDKRFSADQDSFAPSFPKINVEFKTE